GKVWGGARETASGALRGSSLAISRAAPRPLLLPAPSLQPTLCQEDRPLPRQRLPLDSPAHGALGDWADRLQRALRREGLAVEVAVGLDDAPAPLPGDDGLGQAYRVLGADRAAL